MRISELSATSGVPIATIKFYLRERLLPPGARRSATQADYDQSHLRRLRLIRALVEIGGLSLAQIRAVVAVIDSDAASVAEAVGLAHESLGVADPASGQEPRRALSLIESLGWQVDPCSTALHDLDAALAAMEEVGVAIDPKMGEVYGSAALQIAELDIATVPEAPAEDAVIHAVVGTVLLEPVLLALRRLAQQHTYAAGHRPAGRTATAPTGQ